MTNKERVKKSIEKAIKYGWNPISDMGKVDNFKIYSADENWRAIWVAFYTKIGDGGQLDIHRILFDLALGFAQAFWGEPEVKRTINKEEHVEEIDIINHGWKYHLQQMVLEEEPLKYIEKFLDKEAK